MNNIQKIICLFPLLSTSIHVLVSLGNCFLMLFVELYFDKNWVSFIAWVFTSIVSQHCSKMVYLVG